MKKLSFILVAILILCITLMVGCGNKESSRNQTVPDGQEVENWALATSSSGSSPYIMGGALTKVINKYTSNLKVSPMVTAGFTENKGLVNKGQMQLGQVTLSQGDQDFTDLRALFNVDVSAIHVVTADMRIQKIEDLKGKKINIGAPGSITQKIAQTLLSSYGLDTEDYKSSPLTTGESVAAIKDEQIDATIIIAIPPLPGVSELAVSKEIKLIPVDGPGAQKFAEAMGGSVIPTKIPGGIYKGVDQETVTMGVCTTIVSNKNVDEQLIYELTKNIWEHLDELCEAHAGYKTMSLETAVTGINIPLHPGAEKYFKEIGVIE